MTATRSLFVLLGVLAIGSSQRPVAAEPSSAEAEEVRDIGSRLELFVDKYLIDELRGAELRLHPLQPAEASAELEQISGHYGTVLHDGGTFRLFCRGYLVPGAIWRNVGHEAGTLNEVTLYAESPDGIRWTLPNLGLYRSGDIDPRLLEFAKQSGVEPQTEQGNVVLAGRFGPSHNFTPFLDARPGVPLAEQFKAVGGKKYSPQFRKEWLEKYGPDGLYGFVSADGLRWTAVRDEPIIPADWGAFDSQNVAFWSAHEGQYVLYFRYFEGRRRAIRRTTSPDFRQWTEPVDVHANLPDEELYTNNVQPYFRAPHIYVAPATRYLDGQRPNTFVIFMTSRDGVNFDRTFGQQVFKKTAGGDRTNYIAWSNGGTQTGPRELSFYGLGERYTLRLDGFASIRADAAEGHVRSRPLRFAGKRLELNYAAAPGGSVRVEIQRSSGEPVPGFALDDCRPLAGDEIAQAVEWTGGSDLSRLAGQTVRLRFVLKEADLFALQFP